MLIREIYIFCLPLFVLAANIFHFQIRRVVKEHGYRTSLFWGGRRDIRYFVHIIKSEKNGRRKQDYKLLLFGYYGSLGLMIIGVLMFAESQP
jgi:hypothetical protein